MVEERNSRMKVTAESTITAEPSVKPASRPKWHRIYYLLAAFDVITVVVSLYVLSQVMSTYQRSVRVNQEWAGRLETYEGLEELATAVNAPGNDVFDSLDAETESEKLRAAFRLFDERIARIQEELQANVGPTEAAPLQESLKTVASTMAQMVDEAHLIFSHFRQHRPDSAGKRMAIMDRKYAAVRTAVGQLRQQVSDIQQRHLSEQAAASGSLRMYEYIVAFAILLMVAGATAYGRQIAKHVESDAREREEYLERLRTQQAALAVEVAERKRAEAELARLYEVTKVQAVQWEALFSLGRLLNQSLQLDEVFETFAQGVKPYIPYDRLGVIVHEDHTLKVAYAVADPPLTSRCGQSWSMTHDTGIEWIFTHRQPRLVQDLTAEAQFSDDVYMAQEGVRTTLELPLLVGGEVQGVFYLDNLTPAAYSDRDIERLLPLADQVALVLEHSRLYSAVQGHAVALGREVEERTRAEEQLRTLAARLASVQEDERTRLALEVHEELGQLLIGLKMDLSWLAARLPQEQPALALQEKSQAIRESIDEMIRWVRRITGELRPRELDELGLVAAIEWQAKEFQSRTGIRTQLTVQEPPPTLDWKRSTAVFRILQEALSNVARHAQGTRVHINLKADAERLTLEVIDNGKGITKQALADQRSLGLLDMRERTFLLGGAVTIVGQPGQGTMVTVLMPLQGPGEGGGDSSPDGESG
jgi:signal transduction histidine kinase